MRIKLYVCLEMSTVKKVNVIRTLEDFLSWCKAPVAKKKNHSEISGNLTGISIPPAICDVIKKGITVSQFNVSKRETNSRSELINHCEKN